MLLSGGLRRAAALARPRQQPVAAVRRFLLTDAPPAAGAVAARSAGSQRKQQQQHHPHQQRPAAPPSSSLSTKPAPAAQTTSFCFQCEQTLDQKGCGSGQAGVCGKTPDVSLLQDALIQQLKGIAAYSSEARAISGARDEEVNAYLLESMFSTLTNVNFSGDRIADYIRRGEAMKSKAKRLYQEACSAKGVAPKNIQTVDFSGALGDRAQLESLGLRSGVLQRKADIGDEDKWGVGELILLGLKGTMAYYHHATMLGQKNAEVMDFVSDALAKLNHTKETELGDLLGLALGVGEANLKAMDTLDVGHTSTFGNPSPHEVQCGAKAGKCILVSGHDIVDLHRILKATQGKGTNVYTHGELLPAHGYPELRKFSHLKGHYGGPWQLQKMEFARFPGPIVLTSNCLMEPQKRYRDRIFTMNMVGFDNVKHIGKDATLDDVIACALQEKGFAKDEPESTKMVGFGHHAILSMADTIIDHVKSGDIKRFFVIGGCDGYEAERSYFSDLARELPKDAVCLTVGCGKYRFNNIPWETTSGGIPRLLDMGQCNDSIGAVKVAVALANAFKTDVNSLPLSICLSWFEQKAVAVLLTLLHLNIQNIRLGPHLPAFCTPNMLAILQEKFAIKPTADPKKDLQNMMQGK